MRLRCWGGRKGGWGRGRGEMGMGERGWARGEGVRVLVVGGGKRI